MRAIIISSSGYPKVFNLVIPLYNVTIIRVGHKSPKILNSRIRPFLHNLSHGARILDKKINAINPKRTK